MQPVFKVSKNSVGPSVRRYASEMMLSGRQAVRQVARGVTRRVIDITPPSNGSDTGSAALAAGQAKIERQMKSVFAPKKLKGRRKITTVFGRKIRNPVYAQTKEKYPDVASIYRKNTHARGNAIGIRTTKSRVKYYVDVRKFTAVLKARQANVGTLAAGFAAAAAALDVPVQQWISRHGTSGGRVQIDTAGDRMRVVVENFAQGVPPLIRSELARRIGYALTYQGNAMERAIDGYHRRTKQKLGIRG